MSIQNGLPCSTSSKQVQAAWPNQFFAHCRELANGLQLLKEDFVCTHLPYFMVCSYRLPRPVNANRRLTDSLFENTVWYVNGRQTKKKKNLSLNFFRSMLHVVLFCTATFQFKTYEKKSLQELWLVPESVNFVPTAIPGPSWHGVSLAVRNDYSGLILTRSYAVRGEVSDTIQWLIQDSSLILGLWNCLGLGRCCVGSLSTGLHAR